MRLDRRKPDDLSFFQKQIEPYTKKPEFVAAGRVFDARALTKGKSVFYIFTSANAKDAGAPPQLSKGYGDAYVKG